MRGKDCQQPALFSYVSLDEAIPPDHPIRFIREIIDTALKDMDRTFRHMYSRHGRPSIAPERLLRALILQILYSIPSERQLMERLNYDLLFKWFVGLNLDEPVWHATVYCKNRDRLLHYELAEKLFERIQAQAGAQSLLSKDHFTVDGTLLEACASIKSFVPNEGDDDDGGDGPSTRNQDRDYHGKQLRNDTHTSTTDADAKLYRKGPGKEAKLCYMGHVLTENRNGLIVGHGVTPATGTAERQAALKLIQPHCKAKRITLGGDKNYDTSESVRQMREHNVTPHFAARAHSTLDGRTVNTESYQLSQVKRKRVEECFGWMKTIGLLRKLRHRGLPKVRWVFALTAATYNLVRMKNLLYAQ